MKSKIIKVTGIALSLLFTHMASAQQDYRVQIGLDAPAYGTNLLVNFGTYSGPWVRGYSISNHDGSASFIQLATTGDHYSDGTSTQRYSYIGGGFSREYMVFQPDGNIGVGTRTVENSEG
ncbi:hypothetical protein ACFU8T_13355 [Sphingobacterium spiritivorum]|uniref:Uncharacterized protein n=1 Tax=Sphingobacterium spiritivorum ATCC 33861 TaxID=525373 RepID=D7VJX1_SPHSI|nr:hypothetical protein [Sphingobacterium spiritivorum]EFK58573.1 hypothetical protein HMPREF0766_11290 [Sphingobacterium spiritivorum ATCC 33861]QQT34521.1 hypothetical protein I6J01_14495 [Sphingobacterium spiritivorum]WQD35380.1 hypothetical protein U0038_06430 [Sphingobacterium spiritivorum]SUJ00235.1 Uncharacterised protein [Sphingobacterium spiritivorum]